jgi:uncharacterized RDD family membrane protein YckC
VLFALFNRRRRLLHDVVLGTIVVNSEARAGALRLAPGYRPYRPL